MSNATYYNQKDRDQFQDGWFGKAGREMIAREQAATAQQPTRTPDGDLAWNFDNQTKELSVTLPEERAPRKWGAVSGPWGKGPLPSGSYSFGQDLLPKQGKKPFCDENGLCWLKPIQPDFETDRFNLGIHPDGNVPGTEGCIGLTERDTREIYNIMLKHPTGKCKLNEKKVTPSFLVRIMHSTLATSVWR